jgi:hypothetical protein
MVTIPIPIKNYLIVGSYGLNNRYAKDIDVLCYEKDILVPTIGDKYLKSFMYEDRRVECLILDTQPVLKEIYFYHINRFISYYDLLYILKYGHVHIGLKGQYKFESNVLDFHYLKKLSSDSKLIEDLKIRYRKETNKRIKQRTPKLNKVSKEKFFDDFVAKFVEHDDIHEIVAFNKRPVFLDMQKDETVTCHKDLWDDFSFEKKCQCVCEESSVIAIERILLPEMINNVKIKKPSFLAYKWALYRVCTTLTSGWFREFTINNYYTILNMYNKIKFEEDLENTHMLYVNNKMNE